MGTERFYKPGSFYRICDRTGFATRAERTQREWQGLMVRREVFEARQPQDFVKGVNDIQTVPLPRPRPTDVFIGIGTVSEFQVNRYFANDLPVRASLQVTGGQFQCTGGGVAQVDPSKFPSGF